VEVLKTITQLDRQQLDNLVNTLDDSQVITEFKSDIPATITCMELKKLLRHEWLNDNIINAFLSLLAHRAANLNYNQRFYSTYFYETFLQHKDYDTNRWNRQSNVDITTCTQFYFPINVNNLHWVFVFANVSNSTIYYLDSIHNADSMQTILCNIHEYMTHLLPQVPKWTLTSMITPQQTNDINCGVYMCACMEQLSAGISNLIFNDENAMDYCYYMAKQIVEHKQ
jgi:Ulp1 family protease